MPIFESNFSVRAPLQKVVTFHRDGTALAWVTPPPVFVRFQRVGWIDAGEGAISEFTMWFGLLPTRWLVHHSSDDWSHGFTDTLQHGMLASWVHHHIFSAEDEHTTRIHDHLTYEHFPGWRGLVSRLLFTSLALKIVFVYRRYRVRKLLEAP